jgi:hypothetical protein
MEKVLFILLVQNKLDGTNHHQASKEQCIHCINYTILLLSQLNEHIHSEMHLLGSLGILV